MSFVVRYDEFGLINVQSGVADHQATQPYAQTITILRGLWNQSTAPTSTFVNLLVQNARILRTIVEQGVQVGDRTSLVSDSMATQANVLLKSMKAAGLDIEATSDFADQIAAYTRWQDMAEAGRILDDALISATSGNRSIQAMVETDYVQQGNAIVFEEMNDLKNALRVTKDVLALMTEIQNFHNNIVPKDIGTMRNHYEIPGTNFAGSSIMVEWRTWNDEEMLTAWRSWAGQHFNPGRIGVRVDTSQDANILSTLANVEIPRILSELEPLINKLAAQRGGEALVTNSLEDQLIQMRTDLTPLSGNTTNVSNWIIDQLNNTTSVETRGVFQQHITAAMMAASNLNDEQKEDLRRIMFIFEEFYKSASAVLSKITQIIEKIASKVSG